LVVPLVDEGDRGEEVEKKHECPAGHMSPDLKLDHLVDRDWRVLSVIEMSFQCGGEDAVWTGELRDLICFLTRPVKHSAKRSGCPPHATEVPVDPENLNRKEQMQSQ
jgi:hypothetical protein